MSFMQRFTIKHKETVLHIYADCNLKAKAGALVKRYREQIERYIAKYPHWQESFLPVEPKENAPSIVKEMSKAASLCGVGPMAAIAGAIAEFIGKSLLRFSTGLIVENGGDIFLQSNEERLLSIFAGRSRLSEKIGLKLLPSLKPYGVATSAGAVGHSYSAGKANAAVVVSNSAILSDAAATATANIIREKKDIKKGLNFAKKIRGVLGAIIILKDDLGVWNCEISTI